MIIKFQLTLSLNRLQNLALPRTQSTPNASICPSASLFTQCYLTGRLLFTKCRLTFTYFYYLTLGPAVSTLVEVSTTWRKWCWKHSNSTSPTTTSSIDKLRRIQISEDSARLSFLNCFLVSRQWPLETT